jgi:hypothetical protein
MGREERRWPCELGCEKKRKEGQLTIWVVEKEERMTSEKGLERGFS